MTDAKNIALLLEKELDELYADLGYELRGKPAFPPNPKQMVDTAKTWMKSKRAKLQEAVCDSVTVKELAGQNPRAADRVVLVAAVADLISSITIGIAPTTVAVLIVREGVHTLCQNEWKDFR